MSILIRSPHSNDIWRILGIEIGADSFWFKPGAYSVGGQQSSDAA